MKHPASLLNAQAILGGAQQSFTTWINFAPVKLNDLFIFNHTPQEADSVQQRSTELQCPTHLLWGIQRKKIRFVDELMKRFQSRQDFKPPFVLGMKTKGRGQHRLGMTASGHSNASEEGPNRCSLDLLASILTPSNPNCHNNNRNQTHTCRNSLNPIRCINRKPAVTHPVSNGTNQQPQNSSTAPKPPQTNQRPVNHLLPKLHSTSSIPSSTEDRVPLALPFVYGEAA